MPINLLNNFNRVSFADLIAARDVFHEQLSDHKNVVATAIGRYLIRRSDINQQGRYEPLHTGERRGLDNSVVLDISWPCILVFVDHWQTKEELMADYQNLIPKKYKYKGNDIAICIVEAPKVQSETGEVNLDDLLFPKNLMGGGFPMIIESQGTEHIATASCLVSDGHTYYALTNRHVTGIDKSQEIETIIGGRRQVIGKSSGKTLGKLDFQKLYEGWESKRTRVNCDVGLVRVDDITKWKSEIVGIGQMDELYDLNSSTINLNLIAEYCFSKAGEIEPAINGQVTGYGAVSGLRRGEIIALYYRYQSLGGMEYVSDFLIGGRNGQSLQVHHGDSGMLWHLEDIDINQTRKFYPLALHWGQHEFLQGVDKAKWGYSLSTCLSNICRELDVHLERGCNTADEYSWGKVGHYTIGSLAVQSISKEETELKKFMTNNLENISFQSSKINKELDAKNNTALPKSPDEGFCPLADVPDIIWKQSKPYVDKEGKPGGFAWGRKGDENPNHYADADYMVKGKSLYDYCNTAKLLIPQTWIAYYDAVDTQRKATEEDKKANRKRRGLVAFRVWQIFDYMVEAVREKKEAEFIFAAGVLAHYVGDACQPLHSSYMSDGDPADNVTKMYTPPRGGPRHPKGIPYPKIDNPGSGVHVAYEDTMIDDYIDDIMPKVKKIISASPDSVLETAIDREKYEFLSIDKITTGQEAAYAVLQLMHATQLDIQPKAIVEAFKEAKASGENQSEKLYTDFGEATASCIARGCLYLSAIWEGAWRTGKNSELDVSKVDDAELIKLYREPANLESFDLDSIAGALDKGI